MNVHNIFFKGCIGCLPFSCGWTYSLYQLGPPYLFCFKYIVLLLLLLVISDAFWDFCIYQTLIVIKILVHILILLVRGCPSLDFEHYSVHSGLFHQPICPPVIILSAHGTANLPVYLLSLTLSVAYAISIPCFGKFSCFSSPLSEILYCPLLGFDHFFFIIICSFINGSTIFDFLSARVTATFVAFNVYLDTNLSLSTLIQSNFGFALILRHFVIFGIL